MVITVVAPDESVTSISTRAEPAARVVVPELISSRFGGDFAVVGALDAPPDEEPPQAADTSRVSAIEAVRSRRMVMSIGRLRGEVKDPSLPADRTGMTALSPEDAYSLLLAAGKADLEISAGAYVHVDVQEVNGRRANVTAPRLSVASGMQLTGRVIGRRRAPVGADDRDRQRERTTRPTWP